MKELGILVPIVTPCNRQGGMDLAGADAICRDMLDAGCSAIFVAGSTGRGPWFSLRDRMRLCRTAADIVGAGRLLFAGCMASGLPDMLANARAMADSGARIAVLTAPAYFNYSQTEVENIFSRFADKSPLPVVVYDIPVFTGMKLDLAMVSRLCRHGNIIGFKDSSADMARFRQLLRTFRDRPDFYLLQGKEHLLAESIMSGASGLVVSLLHVDPKPYAALYQASRAGRKAEAQKIQRSITRIMNLIEACLQRRPETSTLFHFLNYTLRARGICENIVLEHEGECPDWLAAFAQKALEISAGVFSSRK